MPAGPCALTRSRLMCISIIRLGYFAVPTKPRDLLLLPSCNRFERARYNLAISGQMVGRVAFPGRVTSSHETGRCSVSSYGSLRSTPSSSTYSYRIKPTAARTGHRRHFLYRLRIRDGVSIIYVYSTIGQELTKNLDGCFSTENENTRANHYP